MMQSVPVAVVDLGDHVERDLLQLLEGYLVAFVVLPVEEVRGVGRHLVLPPSLHTLLLVAQDSQRHIPGFLAGTGPDEKQLDNEPDGHAQIMVDDFHLGSGLLVPGCTLHEPFVVILQQLIDVAQIVHLLFHLDQ